MKKAILIFSLTVAFFLGGFYSVLSQEQPKPKKDTVNMDTDAKPTFYYAVEDEKTEPKSISKGAGITALIVGGALVVISIAGYFILRKKKQ